MRLRLSIGLSSFILSACVTSVSPNQKNVDIEAFAALSERTFETPESDTDTIIRDRRIRVQAAALPGVWFYAQMNTGETHKLYRQRLSKLFLSEDGTAIIQRAYGLNKPENYVDAWSTPMLLRSLEPADFKPYFEGGCDQVWTPGPDNGWKGYVDPQTCIITSKRRNTQIRIESESYLSETEYRTTERGYDMDMNALWGSQPGEMIRLYPTYEN